MRIFLIGFFFILFACTHKYPEMNSALPRTLEEAVNFSFRTPENLERDEYQHPKETLEFFGLKTSMAVVEVHPGAGYFTEVLGPYLATEGELYLAVPRMSSRPARVLIDNEKKIQNIMMRHHAVKEHTKLVPFEPIDKRNRTKKSFADVVIAVNSVHNWVANNKINESFKFMHDILKPGGTLGIVQHRIAEGKKNIPKSGYMYESEVIAMAKRAGFKFIGKSEVNANPKDTADYPHGVWTLPPTLRDGEKDKSRYERIGESDRMTLKFVK